MPIWMPCTIMASASGATYRYFKLDVTAVDGGSYVQVDELKLFVASTQYPVSAMTGNSAPSPLVASASSELSGNYAAWRAFDHAVLGGGFIWSNLSGTTGWLKIDLGSGNGIAITSFKLTAGDTANRTPKNFTLQASNDDSSYSTLKSVTGATGWGTSEERTYAIP